MRIFKTTLKEIMNEVHPLEEIEAENGCNLRLKCQVVKEKGNHLEAFKPYFYHFKKNKPV